MNRRDIFKTLFGGLSLPFLPKAKPVAMLSAQEINRVMQEQWDATPKGKAISIPVKAFRSDFGIVHYIDEAEQFRAWTQTV